MSYHPPNNDNYQKDKKSFTVRPANLPPDPELEDTYVENHYLEECYNQGFCVAVINVADEVDKWLGVCFNCGKLGHKWRDWWGLSRSPLKLLRNGSTGKPGS